MYMYTGIHVNIHTCIYIYVLPASKMPVVQAGDRHIQGRIQGGLGIEGLVLGL